MIASRDHSRLLQLWERAVLDPPARRALRILYELSSNDESVRTLSIGERDRQLMLVRRDLFGDRVEGVTECPNCMAKVELTFSVSEVASQGHVPDIPRVLKTDGYKVRWRLPTANDLSELADETAIERVRQQLLERCLLDVRRGRRSVTPMDCPNNVILAVSEAMAEADPFGIMQLDLNCPDCERFWKATFDIGAYLWRELDVWAKRLFGEIHRLAATYGWSEQEILAMASCRRRIYLELMEQ